MVSALYLLGVLPALIRNVDDFFADEKLRRGSTVDVLKNFSKLFWYERTRTNFLERGMILLQSHFGENGHSLGSPGRNSFCSGEIQVFFNLAFVGGPESKVVCSSEGVTN